MDQVVQVVGALLILAAFGLAQFGALGRESYVYLLLNLVGSTLLGVVAYLTGLWGFLLLEVAWALISLWGIADRLRGRSA